MENENEINVDNQEIQTNTIQDEVTEVTLATLHYDLGIICTFLAFASILVFCILVYKLFNIFF